MPLIRYRDKLVLFVHIPKTGGTSVEDAMKQAGATVALRYGSRFRGFMKATFQHLDAEISTSVFPPGFYDYAFGISRHPVPRLVSEFYYRRKRGDKPRSFDTWVNHVLDVHGRNPYAMDNHIRPQVDFVIPDMALFKIEDGLMPALQAAADHLGLPPIKTALHNNRTHQKAPVTWTAQTRDRVLSFYAADFARFGYDPEQSFPDMALTPPKRRFRLFR